MVPILSLLIAIAVSTIFHDVVILTIISLVRVCIFFIYDRFVNKSVYFYIIKKILYIVTIFILSWVATWRYDTRYWDIDLQDSRYFQWDLLVTKVNNPVSWYDRYDVRDIDWNDRILKIHWKYEPWDVLQLSATIDFDSYIDEKIWFDGTSSPSLYNSIDVWSIDDWEYNFDYDRWLKMKWYIGILETNRATYVGSILDSSYKDIDSNLYHWWDKFTLGMRSYIKKVVLSSYGQDRYWWLMLGMIVGDRSMIPKSDYDGFIDSGLVHLIAVSGGNISMIVIFLWLILFFLPYYIRIGVILISILLYSMVCGLDSSVFRAMVMWSLTIFAIYTGRVADGFRVLGIALFVMLFYNPYFLSYDMWFVLSFMATLWIMTVSKIDIFAYLWSFGRYKIIRYIWHNYIIPSIWAILGILPVLLFYNSQYNLTWFIWNLLVIPLVPVMMVWGIVIGLFSYTFPNLYILDIFINILTYLLKRIYYISELVNQWWVYVIVDGFISKILVISVTIWIIYSTYNIEFD